ncbi:Na(+)/H(+) antiporter subunit B [Alteribacter aurantiacus]|uniref:Na(+)/H(+) antiporter subunit B n=1 Tax=Alteribacter aurantiacus TaxID=254410 RepID=UPI00041A1F7A|nr:Na(+)/H(+) antiporter subunit B [Alteribacter aurantiacus]
MKTNYLMLHTITRIVALIILSFSVYLFFAGHYTPGGGFIGGLMFACGLLLLYLSFDLNKIQTVLPIDFEKVIAIGLLIGIGTGLNSLLFGDPFFTMYFDTFTIWPFGEVALTTTTPFAIAIFLVVVGVALLTILTIAGDEA